MGELLVRPSGWPSATTALAGLIGDPVAHSLSPTLHNAAFAALGLDWAYVACLVHEQDVRAALVGARALGFRGLSVTMPHKTAIAIAADQRSRTVERLGAANTVAFTSGIAVAESTDGEGLLDDLGAAGFEVSGARCAVIGAGGAARAAVLALASAGASEVIVVNRSEENARRAAALAGDAGRIAERAELADVALVVQATPIGMARAASADDPGAELGRLLGRGQLVVDLVYYPRRTAFLEAAAEQGAQVLGGLGTLVRQAARQVELWTGEPAPLEAMWQAVGEP